MAFGEKMQIGRVVSNTFGVIGRNPVTFLGLSFLLVTLPQAAIGYVTLGGTSFGAAAMWTNPKAMAGSGFSNLFSTLLILTLQAALIAATVDDLNNRPVSIMACFGVALRKLPIIILLCLFLLVAAMVMFFPLAFLAAGLGLAGIATSSGALAVLMVFGTVIGAFVLVGLVISAYIVTIPAMVTENLGVFGSLGRSWALTKGARLRIFLCLSAYVVFALVVGGFIAMVGYMMSETGSATGIVSGMAGVPLLLVSAGINAATTAISCAGVASIYIELRTGKEGVDNRDLGAIFA